MIRTLTKWSLVAAAGVVVLGVLVGPDRVGHLASTARQHLTSNVDGMIDQEVKLTRELERLQTEYPRQLAELRSELREVDLALREVSDEVAVAEQVVALCSADLQELRPSIATVGLGTASSATLQARLDQVERTREVYDRRLTMGAEEKVMLETERRQLASEIDSLEREAAEFQAQAALLQREIESVSRNETLIRIAEERRDAREARLGRRNRTALTRFHEEISERRAEQGERLRMLQGGDATSDYEQRARQLLERKAVRGVTGSSEDALAPPSESGLF